MYVDVLILNPESNYDQVFTYENKAGSDKAEPGCLVTVSVRQQIKKGLVLREQAHKPQVKVIKPVIEVLHREPLVSTLGLDLAQWISGYYACSLNKAMHLFLPPPVRQMEREVLVTGRDKGTEDLFLSESEQEILNFIRKKGEGGVSPRSLRSRFGPGTAQALSMLLENDFLKLEKSLFSRIKTKSREMVILAEGTPAWQDLKKRSPRQADVMAALAQGPKSKEELYKLGGNSAVVKALKDKGWINVYPEEVARDPKLSRIKSSARPQVLNEEQLAAAEVLGTSIRNSLARRFLLFGVTGSGKTEVYLQAMEETLTLGRQVLYLVPEISLTPQISAVLLDSFGSSLAILHSSLSLGERHDEWMRIREGEARVVLGPRSAVFAPFTSLGLIIIDEEHETTYKQSEPDPRYDARRVAIELADRHGATLVMGSATPSIGRYYETGEGSYDLLPLSRRVASRPLPEIRIVDMKLEARLGHRAIFSRLLLDSLQRVTVEGEQAILFINRRGFHTYILCQECGKALTCPSCSIALTYHKSKERLTCHYCNYQRSLPQNCPSCGSRYIRYFGTGTERVALELENYLPGVKCLRMDADTTRTKDSHTQILKEFQEGKAQVLIGTQMIAKGLDFPSVTLVGVVNPDMFLNMPDYQAGERSYQLLTQVAGRAGRGERRGEVIIQTFNPEHYLFPALLKQDYDDFYRQEISNRALLQYPPCQYLARIMCSGFPEKKVTERVDYLAELLKIEIGRNELAVEILGPSPAPLSFIRGRHRYHLILKGPILKDLQTLAHIIRELSREMPQEPRIIIDIEPQTLL